MPALPFPRIVSGGQTGADRAALDFALAHGIAHGGFCPAGRRAEDGRIPDRYTLRELESRNYAVRTEANVRAADATVAFSVDRPTGGTALTLELAARAGKPHLLITGEPAEADASRLLFFLRRHAVRTLNVAGPRGSNAPGIDARVRDTLAGVLGLWTGRSPRRGERVVSVWLMPSPPARDPLQSWIDDCASRLGSPRFAPHVTLASIECAGDLEGLRATLTSIPAITHRPLELAVEGIHHSAELRRTLYLELAETPALIDLTEVVVEGLDGRLLDVATPHLSLAYARASDAALRAAAGSRPAPGAVRFDRVELRATPWPFTEPEQAALWQSIAGATLAPDD